MSQDLSPAPAPRRRRRWPLVLLAGLVLLGGLGFAGWWFFIRDDAPPPVALSNTPAAPPAAAGTISGTWRVAPGSFARYRVTETLAGLPNPTEAVGRTDGVTGQAVLQEDGERVTVREATFEADLLGLKSDKGQRDNALRTRGIETQKFPKATFVLAQPVTAPRTGGTVQAVGDLTLHGQTKRVTIPLQTQLAGQQIELVGSLKFPFADFGMQRPVVGSVLSIEDQITLEVQLFLAKA